MVTKTSQMPFGFMTKASVGQPLSNKTAVNTLSGRKATTIKNI